MVGMSLRLEPRVEQKQELKQELQQKQTLEQTLSLNQYLKWENLIEGLVKYAFQNDKWVNFDKDGFNFNYALVPYRLAKPIAKDYGPAFAHCKFDPFEVMFQGKKMALAKGDWIQFVVEDKVPENLRDYLAIHERGEELSLGNHYFASQLEFAYSTKNKATKDYIKYIDENFPSKFVDLEEKVRFPVLPQELVDFISEQQISSQKASELKLSENMIEEYPMPDSVIKKMDQYSKQTDLVCKRIQDCVPRLQKGIFNMLSERSIGKYTTEDLANFIDKEVGSTMKNLPVKNLKALSKPKINQSLEILSEVGLRDVKRDVKANLVLENNLVKMIQKSKVGKSLVDVQYSAEQKAGTASKNI